MRSLRKGLCHLTMGLRMLEGQVHSYNECVRLGVEPGSRCLDKKLLPRIRLLHTHVRDLLGILSVSNPNPQPNYINYVITNTMSLVTPANTHKQTGR